MHILILGGSGFMGPYIARSLLRRGHAVTVFHRGKTNTGLPKGAQEITGDWGTSWQRAGLVDLRPRFAELAPDAVIDMRIIGEQDAAHLQQSLRGLAGRLVAISSQDVYRAYARFIRREPGEPDPTPITEESPLRDTLYPYRSETSTPDDFTFSYDKIPAERLLLDGGDPPTTVLRLPAVYGPNDRQYRFYPFVKRMLDGRPAILLSRENAGWLWTHAFAADVGEAVALAAGHPAAAGRIYNLGEAHTPTMLERLETIAALLGWQGRFVLAEEASLPAAMQQPYDWRQALLASSERIRSELGFRETITVEESLRQTIEWQRATPPAQSHPADFDYAAEDQAIANSS